MTKPQWKQTTSTYGNLTYKWDKPRALKSRKAIVRAEDKIPGMEYGGSLTLTAFIGALHKLDRQFIGEPTIAVETYYGQYDYSEHYIAVSGERWATEEETQMILQDEEAQVALRAERARKQREHDLAELARLQALYAKESK